MKTLPKFDSKTVERIEEMVEDTYQNVPPTEEQIKTLGVARIKQTMRNTIYELLDMMLDNEASDVAVRSFAKFGIHKENVSRV